LKIHHLGIVTLNVDEALNALGLDRSNISEVVFDPDQKNNLYFIFIPENNMWIELVEPTSADASTYNFAKKYGLGLHHLAIDSTDLEKDELKYGIKPGSFVIGRYEINVKSFGGAIRTLFIAAKGLILEYVKVNR
jgi:hypothetical protein